MLINFNIREQLFQEKFINIHKDKNKNNFSYKITGLNFFNILLIFQGKCDIIFDITKKVHDFSRRDEFAKKVLKIS